MKSQRLLLWTLDKSSQMIAMMLMTFAIIWWWCVVCVLTIFDIHIFHSIRFNGALLNCGLDARLLFCYFRFLLIYCEWHFIDKPTQTSFIVVIVHWSTTLVSANATDSVNFVCEQEIDEQKNEVKWLRTSFDFILVGVSGFYLVITLLRLLFSQREIFICLPNVSGCRHWAGGGWCAIHIDLNI